MLHAESVFEKANELKRQGIPFVLATVVRCESPTSAKPGAKAIINAEGEIEGWIGGGCAQPAVIATAKKALQDGQPCLIRVSPTKNAVVEQGIVDFGMTCHSGGTLDIFIEPVVARPALLVIGSSPCAQALAALANRIGFAVTAACAGASSDIFPGAARIVDGLDVASITNGTPPFVVVATQGKQDEAGLEAALTTGSPYIAFVASERKAEKLRAYLKERGHDAAYVDAIIAPAGIEIGAVTPEEIALSVLAGVVQARRSGLGAVTAAVPQQPAETQIQVSAERTSTCCGHAEKGPAQAIDPVCGMTVDTAGAEYHSEHSGQSYYFCCAYCQHRFEKEPEKYLEAVES